MAFALLPLIVRTVLMTWSFSLDPETSHDPATLSEAHALGKTVDEIDADRKLALILLMPVRITYALLYVPYMHTIWHTTHPRLVFGH